MNKERILRLADAVEKHEIDDLGFNMSDWVIPGDKVKDLSGHKCSTTACLAGWAVALSKEGKAQSVIDLDDDPRYSFFDAGQDWLGITEKQANVMFYAPFDFATVTEAVWMLRNFAETGQVVWVMINRKP